MRTAHGARRIDDLRAKRRERLDGQVGYYSDVLGLSVDDAAAGIARVAATEMAQAARERGVEPAALAAVGGGHPVGGGELDASARLLAAALEIRWALQNDSFGV